LKRSAGKLESPVNKSGRFRLKLSPTWKRYFIVEGISWNHCC